jgi:hypothetical protein
MSKYTKEAAIYQKKVIRVYMADKIIYKDEIKNNLDILGFKNMSNYITDLIEKDLTRRNIINKKTGV